MRRKRLKKALPAALFSASLLLGSLNAAAAETGVIPSDVTPPSAAWGTFADSYKNNSTDHMSPDENPALGILSGYSSLWKTGDAWNTGTKLNQALLDANIQKVVDITNSRTQREAEAAYYDDRRNQSYSVSDGLGPLTEAFRAYAWASTTIDSIPADATTTKYDDKGSAGSTDSPLGPMVKLVSTLRGSYSSTSPAKAFFQYPRPFRWSDEVVVVPQLVPAENADPTNDGGYPSGHTNAAYLAAFAMAYAVPERFQELLTRASELGNNRIVAGMHSPFDVMGGRMMATALAAAILNDPDNADIKKAAYNNAHEVLLAKIGTSEDRFSNYESNKKAFTERLTYGFTPTGDTSKPVVVPKGAEVLLETRLPYLDATQRRWVLATTGLPSGNPVLDDAEGWGRLNLFAAADGYGAFAQDVTVNMDAAKGGFNAEDSWRNDISGSGRLTKTGTGTLHLEGNNSYTGGTQVELGTLEADSQTALGNGAVTNNGGTVSEDAAGAVQIGGGFTQSANGTLELNISSKADVLQIQGEAALGGKLVLNFAGGFVPEDGFTIIQSGSVKAGSRFASVTATGLQSSYQTELVYTADSVQLRVTKK